MSGWNSLCDTTEASLWIRLENKMTIPQVPGHGQSMIDGPKFSSKILSYAKIIHKAHDPFTIAISQNPYRSRRAWVSLWTPIYKHFFKRMDWSNPSYIFNLLFSRLHRLVQILISLALPKMIHGLLSLENRGLCKALLGQALSWWTVTANKIDQNICWCLPISEPWRFLCNQVKRGEAVESDQCTGSTNSAQIGLAQTQSLKTCSSSSTSALQTGQAVETCNPLLAFARFVRRRSCLAKKIFNTFRHLQFPNFRPLSGLLKGEILWRQQTIRIFCIKFSSMKKKIHQL